jgi:NitT/TauT family transport system substrate-binding protein
VIDAGLMPCTSFVALYDAGAPVTIVAGGGIEGCVLVAQPGLDAAAKLKGKTLGTFQLDTLEVLPCNWFKRNGVGEAVGRSRHLWQGLHGLRAGGSATS